MLDYQQTIVLFNKVKSVLYVLYEPRPNLALHLERSPLKHSYGYASAGDRPTCLARFALNLESRREMRTSEAN